jgi:hypothetical protein
MQEKLLELFKDLNEENQQQILDYAMMLWEMEQGERQLNQQLGIPLNKEEEVLNKMLSQQYLKKDDKNIN